MDVKLNEEPNRGVRQPYRLTPQERRIILAVATVCFIVLSLWLLAVILMLPNPSQGI